MYALANVRKFVGDNKERLQEGQAEEILARAEEVSENGFFSGSSVEEIMGDMGLANEFHDVATSDPEHLRLGFAAIGSTLS